ncbi:MAG: hypothetical protein IT181_25590, partial [Acidobacteria bacterium]|nr:hypothetical protein [Acidobacteriota bacterium]
VATRPFTGSIAQYYYGGKAKTQSLVNIATGIDQATLSRTTESAIVTSLDLSGRVEWDHQQEARAVVRSSNSTNLLSGGVSKTTTSAAYVDYRRNAEGLAIRAGRQSPISGGLLGLFDGVSLVYALRPGLKVDLMGGTPANALVSTPGERLMAAVIEADGLFERFGGSLYLLDQSSQGITNRRALGGEARYAGEQWSINALADYETEFRKLNAVSLQGSVQLGTGRSLTLLVDERRAPSLQLSNALISSGVTSLQTLLQAKSLEQVRADALATSATARQFLISYAHPLSKRWQLAADLRYSEIGALPAVGDFQATPATGAQVTLTAQLVGTNLYSPRDINNLNLSVTRTPFFNGVQLSYSNVTGLLEDSALSIEPSLRYYTQRDQQDVKLTRIGPGVRLSYRASRRANLLAEALYEQSRTRGPTGHDQTQSTFFYVGYRYDLF